jgi:thioesterase domain-containing protein
MTPESLTDYLHRHIPLTAALGATVVRSAVGEIEISAPLAPNLNHRNTAFGGSLATLGIVSGWALLHQALAREGLHPKIVIQRSECDFLEPVATDFRAISRLPETDWAKFLKTLRRHHRARIAVDTALLSAGQPAVNHRGVFVAVEDGQP